MVGNDETGPDPEVVDIPTDPETDPDSVEVPIDDGPKTPDADNHPE